MRKTAPGLVSVHLLSCCDTRDKHLVRGKTNFGSWFLSLVTRPVAVARQSWLESIVLAWVPSLLKFSPNSIFS